MIRKATDSDIPELVGFLRLCFSDGFDSRGYPWDTRSVTAMVMASMAGKGAAFVSVDDGRIVGAMICLVTPYLTDHRRFRAAEIVWHADPTLSDYRRARIMVELLRAMQTWSEAAELDLYVSTFAVGARSLVGNFLDRQGFEPMETVFRRQVSHGH